MPAPIRRYGARRASRQIAERAQGERAEESVASTDHRLPAMPVPRRLACALRLFSLRLLARLATPEWRAQTYHRSQTTPGPAAGAAAKKVRPPIADNRVAAKAPRVASAFGADIAWAS